jgi:hypothetical protein
MAIPGNLLSLLGLEEQVPGAMVDTLDPGIPSPESQRHPSGHSTRMIEEADSF